MTKRNAVTVMVLGFALLTLGFTLWARPHLVAGDILPTPTPVADTPTPPASPVTTPGIPAGVPYVAPFLVPDDTSYLPVDTSAIPSLSPVPQAILVPAPLGAQTSASVFVARDSPTFGTGDIGFIVLSAVKYQARVPVDDKIVTRTVVITVAEPSPAALAQGVSYGDQTVSLPDGSTVTGTTAIDGATENAVFVRHGNKVVTLAGDLPLDQLASLVSNIQYNG